MSFGRNAGMFSDEWFHNRFYILEADMQDSVHYEKGPFVR